MRRKTICCLLSAALLLLLVPACGGAGTGSSHEKDVPLSTLQEEMLKADTTLPYLIVVSSEEDPDKAEENFRYLSELSYDKVEGYFYACAQDVTAEEIAVIQLKDSRDAAAMMESLHDHVDLRMGSFRQYGPDQVPLLEQAVIIHEGRYVALIICEKNGLVQNAFRDSFS